MFFYLLVLCSWRKILNPLLYRHMRCLLYHLVQFWIMYVPNLLSQYNGLNLEKSAKICVNQWGFRAREHNLRWFQLFYWESFYPTGYPYPWAFSSSIILEFLCPCTFPLLFVTNICALYTDRARSNWYHSSLHKKKKVVWTSNAVQNVSTLYRAYIGCSKVRTEVYICMW
jgi:hypothetical protein